MTGGRASYLKTLCEHAATPEMFNPLVSVRFVPLLQVDIRFVLLFLFNRRFPRLVGLLGIGPVGLLPRIVKRSFARIFVLGLGFAHARTTKNSALRSRSPARKDRPMAKQGGVQERIAFSGVPTF